MINKKKYIGRTYNFEKRKNSHFSDLRNGDHDNKHLQNSFNKYSEDNFLFEIIEYCEKENCETLEQKYIDAAKKDWINYYNIAENASGGSGPCSEETKKKISEANKGKVCSGETRKKMSEINKGKIHSQETKQKMSNAHSGERNAMFGKTR